MRGTLTSRVAVAVSVACLAAACGAEPPGVPEPAASTSSSGAASALPKHGAPDVQHPLDTSGVASDACSALTSKQIESFAGEFEEKKHFIVDAKSHNCQWIFTESGTYYPLADLIGGLNLEDSSNGLSTIYLHHTNGDLGTFKPLQVEGYPAVIYSNGEQRSGRCVLAVGVSNKVAYVADVSTFEAHPKFDQPCELAKKFAGYVVQNLKDG